MMAGRGSPHLDPADYTPHEPPGWNEYTDDAFVAPAGSPYFMPQDSSFNMSETFVEPTQEEGIVNWIGNKWDKGKSRLRHELGIPRGSGPYWPTSSQGRSNLKDWLFNKEVSSSQGLPALQMSQSQWKRPENLEKTIKSLELRPEFEGWTHDEIKYWIINQARANRGGIIGLL